MSAADIEAKVLEIMGVAQIGARLTKDFGIVTSYPSRRASG